MFARDSIKRRSQTRRLFGEGLEARRLLAGDGSLQLAQFESAAELESFLLEDALARWEGLFGQPSWGWWGGPILAPGCPECEVAFGDAPGVPNSQDHSDTNTQEVGVDEHDIVETDGDYLYVLAGQELVIADAWQPSEMGVVSRVELDGQPVGEYLRNDRLTVISTSFDGYIEPWQGGVADLWMPDYQGMSPKVIVTVLDVADRAAPKIVQKTELDGSFVDSRAVNDSAYVITSDSFGLSEPQLHCDDIQDAVPGPARPTDDLLFVPPFASQCVYETREEYLQRVAGNVLELGLPNYASFGANDRVGETGFISEPTEIYKPLSKEYWNLISVSVFDMAGDEPGAASSTSVPTTYSTTVYGSTDSLYLTNPDWGSGWGGQEATSILKFDMIVEDARVDLTAVGQVPGRVLNSFSMDEYDSADGNEYLRIATSNGWGADTENRVFVLQQTGEDLQTVGQTERLAPGEQIYSVRYVGDIAYVVTFRQVDPLFAIDMSVPTDPQVKGDLHIPGFSNYLQPLRDDFLIGLGRNADPNTGRVQELQVSLFNVADLSAPQLADRFSFDVPGWAWSEAFSDHHAISYFPEYQVLTIPISNDGWVWIDRNSDGISDIQSYRPRTDLYVFNIEMPSALTPDTKPSIQFLGTIQDDAAIRRSVRIEQFLYSISDNSVSVHEILNPKVQIAELHFGQEDVGVPIFTADRDSDFVQVAIASPESTPPQVVDIKVGSSDWDGEFLNYLDAQRAGVDEAELLSVVPFAGVDQIKVQFNEDVYVGFDDVRVIGKDKSPYPIREFTYDGDTATAVWTLAEPIDADAVTVQLSSIVDLAGNSLDGDANGRAGGRFQATYTVLPGDTDGDGRVDLADLANVQAHAAQGLDDPAYSLAQDVNGDRQIDSGDLIVIMSNLGSQVPEFVAPLAGDANRDGVFDSTDLIQVMQAGTYRTGEYATWEGGDWNRDGVFDEADLVHAFQAGSYRSEPAASVRAIDWVLGLAASEAETERKMTSGAK